MKEHKEKYDIYYDNEITPPSWMVRRYYKEKNRGIIVTDVELVKNKKQAKKKLKQRIEGWWKEYE